MNKMSIYFRQIIANSVFAKKGGGGGGKALQRKRTQAEWIFCSGLSIFHRSQFDSNKGKHIKRFSNFEKLKDSYRRTRFD